MRHPSKLYLKMEQCVADFVNYFCDLDVDSVLSDYMNQLRQAGVVWSVGVCLILYVAWRVLCGVRRSSVYFRSCKFDFNYQADDGYALITGGAGGIGKACAAQFAQRGIDIFLIDFNGALLEQTVTDLRKQYPKINIKSKVMDLTKLKDENVYNQFEEEIGDLKIGILFNNAGIAEYKLLRFVEDTHKEIAT